MVETNGSNDGDAIELDVTGSIQNEPKEEEQPEEEKEEKPEGDNSFRKRVFEEVPHLWGVAAPIAIRDLSVLKDKSKSSKGGSDFKGAPNFMTAIIGSWLASKLGCLKPAPSMDKSKNDNDHDVGISDKYVIHKISAVLAPGEATLIIAPSSSGKTTLMRTIANLCESAPAMSSTEGSLLIGGCDPSDPMYEGCFRRSTAFADQGDLTLTPVLTVEETLCFTSSCAENGTEEEIKENVANFLRLAGLSHVAGTVVGDAEIRGVSGGQKRRVKVMEQAVGQDVRVLLLDEITNGLDSASALATCQNVRVAVEKTGCTAIVSLLQPSPESYSQFQRLIILTEHGELAYSGKREAAVGHFQSLGLSKPADMDEPEFLLRCAFKPESFASNDDESKLTPSALAGMFPDSEAGKVLNDDLDVAESTKAKEEPKKLSLFANSQLKQLVLLLGRGKKLAVRNPGTWIRQFFAVIFGLFIGTLFLNTPSDAAGTQTRAGYAFTSLMLLFNIGASSPLEANFNDRVTFYCHRQANFYSTKAYYISTMICSWPVSFLEATFVSLCSFFCVGMETYGGWGFLYFWLLAICISFNGLAVSRILSFAMPSNDVAAALGPAVLMFFTLTAGFAPQYPDIPIWLRWISWLSPCAYGFEGILINELHMRTVSVDGNTVPGSEFGQEFFSIPRIPYDQASAGLRTPGAVMAFDIYMLITFTILFEILGCCLLHASIKWYGPTTKRYQVTSGNSLTNRNDVMAQLFSSKSFHSRKVEPKAQSSVPAAPPAHLTSKDVVYEVDIPIKSDKDEKKEEEKVMKETKTSWEGGAEPGDESVRDPLLVDDDERALLTARDYAQPGKGIAKEWVLKRTVGSDSFRSSTSSSPEFIRVEALAAAEDGTADELEPPAPGRLRLLSGITSSFSPGTMTALMGSSGAGKTTLLDVLAGYKTGGHITGEISLNGVPKTDEMWRRVAGYCEQVDLHNPAMTVRESLLFAARMRLRPFSLSQETRMAYCEENMKLLELEEYADILVGDEAAGQGLPKHARKRLTLGVELSANPSILFADEPTSGLDSLSAALVVSSLQRIATSRGVTVVCTIHQPSKEVFETFENLLLLKKGGVVVYNGPIKGISDYLVSMSGDEKYALKPGANPADHALDILCGPGGEGVDWGVLYKRSSMASDVNQVADESSSKNDKSGGINIDNSEKRGAFAELQDVLQRQLLSNWRTPTYMAVRFWWTLLASFLVSFVFMGLPDTSNGAFNLIGAIFNFVNLGTVPLMSASVPLITERAVFYRETSSGTYRKPVYALAVELAEIPFNLLMAVVSWIIFYWIVGLDSRWDRVIYNLLMTLGVYWILPLFGQLFSFISPNIGIASVIGGILLVAFTLTMGFLIAPENIPPWWIWVYWINPLRYVLQGLAVNELGDGKTYLDEETGDYVSGDDLLDFLGGWSFSQRWWYCFIVVLMFGAAASFGLVGAVRINFMKR